MKLLPYALFITLLSVFSFPTHAEDTRIMVRAKAVDAKFIGTSVGGIRVVVEDAETDEILDEGWINGDTGNTDTLIKNVASHSLITPLPVTWPKSISKRLVCCASN